MKKLLVSVLFLSALIWCACGSGDGSAEGNQERPRSMIGQAKASDGKGIGEIRNVELTDPLDEGMVKRGKAIVDMKCAACHRLNDMRVVGPGFQGVTNKRRPEWIMNMITNVDVMLDQDPVARQLLEECLTRMPNQNVSIGDARDILEFLRQNDLDTIGEKDKAI